MTARVGAIVLAAGQGRRFGADDRCPKVVALFRGVPLVRAVAMTALASRAVSVTVVSGHAHDEIETALSGLKVDLVPNPAFATGMASSLKAGLATMSAAVGGVLVMLADMPCVQVGTLDRLIARFEDRAAPIDAVVPVYDGRRGNPVLIGRRLFDSIHGLSGDEGARSLLRKPDVLVDLCDVADPGVTTDVDTRAELETLNRFSSTAASA